MVFLYIFLSFVQPLLDPDTPWHLKTGDYIFHHRTIPTSDPFSFSTDEIQFVGKFILTQNWISQILFFLLYRTFGPFGLALTGAAVFTALSLILWSFIRKKNVYISLVTVAALSVIILKEFSGIRPQIFSFLFTGAVIFMLEKYRDDRSPRWLVLLPMTMMTWANMHGGFIYGDVLISIYMLSEALKFFLPDNYFPNEQKLPAGDFFRFLGSALSAIAMSFINPNTYKAFIYTFMTHSKDHVIRTYLKIKIGYHNA